MLTRAVVSAGSLSFSGSKIRVGDQSRDVPINWLAMLQSLYEIRSEPMVAPFLPISQEIDNQVSAYLEVLNSS